MAKFSKKRNYAQEFSDRIKEYEKTPEWWIEGIELYLGETTACLKKLKKLLKKIHKNC